MEKREKRAVRAVLCLLQAALLIGAALFALCSPNLGWESRKAIVLSDTPSDGVPCVLVQSSAEVEQ